ncbi:MAG: hypothetical protein ACRDGA_08890, partial [Bacteroidota bacterium]
LISNRSLNFLLDLFFVSQPVRQLCQKVSSRVFFGLLSEHAFVTCSLRKITVKKRRREEKWHPQKHVRIEIFS